MGDDRIVNAILAFRKGNVIIHPGGGGQYGWLELPENLKNEEIRQTGQLSFADLEEINPTKASKPEKNRAKNLRKKPGETEKEKPGNQEPNNTEPDDAGQSSLFDF